MRFLYINTQNLYPPDKHLIEGLKECGHEILEVNKVRENNQNDSYYRLGKNIKENISHADAVIVGYPSPLLVIFTRFITAKKIFFNAVSSQYEANIISRGTGSQRSLTALKWWTVDFLSFHFATKVLLESSAQMKFVQKLFLVPKKKLVRSFTGITEKDFYYNPSVKKLADFTVLFRGKFLPESGVLTVIEAAKKLENTGIRFRVIGGGLLYKEVNFLMDELKPTNVELIQRMLPIKELREKMQECRLSLGQLAKHPRLDHTLPHKLFESLALGLPYLTGRNKGVLELLEENKTCITVNPGDADDLAKKIKELAADPATLNRIALAGHNLYKQELTSRKLAEDVMRECFK